MIDVEQAKTLRAMHIEWPGVTKHWDDDAQMVTFVVRKAHLMANFEVNVIDQHLVVASELCNLSTERAHPNDEWFYSLAEHGLEGCVGLAVFSIEQCLALWMR